MMTGLPFHTLVVVIRIITYHNDDTCEPRQPTTDNPLSSELNIEQKTHTRTNFYFATRRRRSRRKISPGGGIWRMRNL